MQAKRFLLRLLRDCFGGFGGATAPPEPSNRPLLHLSTADATAHRPNRNATTTTAAAAPPPSTPDAAAVSTAPQIEPTDEHHLKTLPQVAACNKQTNLVTSVDAYNELLGATRQASSSLADASEIELNLDTCPVCCDELVLGPRSCFETLKVSPGEMPRHFECGHALHVDCYAIYIASQGRSCPICKLGHSAARHARELIGGDAASPRPRRHSRASAAAAAPLHTRGRSFHEQTSSLDSDDAGGRRRHEAAGDDDGVSLHDLDDSDDHLELLTALQASLDSRPQDSGRREE